MAASGTSRFLVNWIHSLTQKQIFFGVWIFIVGGFVVAFIRFYQRSQRRNFRPDDGNRRTVTSAVVTTKSAGNSVKKG